MSRITVGDIFIGACTVVATLGLAAISIYCDNGDEYVKPSNDKKNTVGYNDAVNVILNEVTFSSTKEELMSLLKRNEDEEYYKTVINIIRAGGFSSSMVSMIEILNEK